MIKVAVLLSIGRHPSSGRARRAPLDARALELALRLPDADIHAIHAGDPSEPVLRDYLGMGLKRLTVLEISPESDPVPALVAHLRKLGPDLIFAGRCAERGEDSGMIPYTVAQTLGHPLLSDVADVTVNQGLASLIQALPRGRRRLAELRLPFVAAVHPAAPEPRQSAFARGRRGIIDAVAAQSEHDVFARECEIRPWRLRPRRLRLASGGSALERLKAVTETKSGQGQVLIGPSPDEAARAIYDYLLERRMIDAPSE
jgi:electron transfer flavoprotein beta subunit